MLFHDKIFGQINITEPVILELIETPQMQRLKKIHQSGIFYYFYPQASQNRFEHSLGVYWLLKYYGARPEEQVAGLLHDISHTVFSHVIDHLYDSYADESHQDSTHQQFFKNNEIAGVLKKYKLDIDKISDLNQWALLDKPLPDICADRLQYALLDSITIGKLNQPTAQKFIKDIEIIENQFVFSNRELAKDFAELTLWMNQNFWHGDWGAYSFHIMKEILKFSLDNLIITEDDLLTDDETIDIKMHASNNKILKGLLSKLKNFKKENVIQDNINYDFVKKATKMRVVDPLVKINDKLVRVTEIFPDFKKKFETERQRVLATKYLRYLE